MIWSMKKKKKKRKKVNDLKKEWHKDVESEWMENRKKEKWMIWKRKK